MPFELKDSKDNKVVFKGTLTTKDYESGALDNGSIDGRYDIVLPTGILKSQKWVVNGINLMHAEYNLQDYAEFDWKGDLDLVTMYFNLKGKFSLSASDGTAGFELGNNEHNLFYGREAGGRMKMEELKMKSFMIQFTKDAFFKIALNGNDALKRFADNVAAGRSVAFSRSNLNIDLAIQNSINAILNCRYADSLKRVFYYSKAIELLVLQAESFNTLMSGKTVTIKSDYDKERILFAKDHLVQHIDTPLTLTELSRIAGINEFKLKRGFKEIFGTTVFGYLSEVKMELAKTDLLEKRKTATEIAFELGFSSVQHFSNAFRKKFGISPSQVK